MTRSRLLLPQGAGSPMFCPECSGRNGSGDGDAAPGHTKTRWGDVDRRAVRMRNGSGVGMSEGNGMSDAVHSRGEAGQVAGQDADPIGHGRVEGHPARGRDPERIGAPEIE